MKTKTKNVKVTTIKGFGASYEWDSYEEFAKDVEEIAVASPALIPEIKGIGGSHNEHWFGHSQGYDGVVNATINGWPEMRKQLEKKLEDVELELPPDSREVRRRKRTLSDHGDELLMPRVWNGQLGTAWRRMRHVNRLQPNERTITLAIDVTANGIIDNSKGLWRAALALKLADAMARTGRDIEIVIIDTTSGPFDWSEGSDRPMRLVTAWTVKRTTDPLNMDRLAAMASVGFMRTAGFVAMDCGPWRKVQSAFGGALGFGLPAGLLEREKRGELVLRIGPCFSREAVELEFKKVCAIVEQHSAAAREAAGVMV